VGNWNFVGFSGAIVGDGECLSRCGRAFCFLRLSGQRRGFHCTTSDSTGGIDNSLSLYTKEGMAGNWPNGPEEKEHTSKQVLICKTAQKRRLNTPLDNSRYNEYYGSCKA
jgi:hypothetical protein